MRKSILYALIALIANTTFLFAPKPSPNPFIQCKNNYVEINRLMGIQVNCDAFTFLRSSIHPSYLLQPGFSRQSRPVYIIFGTIAGYSLYYLTKPFHTYVRQSLVDKIELQTEEEKQRIPLFASFYASYIFLNLLILTISLWLFERIINLLTGDWKNSKLLLLALMVTLAANQVTKDFFWTAHLQMLTILTPLFCLYTGFKSISLHKPKSRIFISSFAYGCLVLMYGNFLLLLPTVLFSYLLLSRKQEGFNSSKFIAISLLTTVVFFLPTFIWILILKMIGVNFYSDEVGQYRQFIWITDVARKSAGDFLKAVYYNTTALLKTTGSLLFLTIFLGTILIFRRNTRTESYREEMYKIIFGFVIVEFIAFFWLLGYYADRLTYSFAPLILCIEAVLINQQKISRLQQNCLVSMIAFWHFYLILFDAPHFSLYFFH